ncbi:hypothetical protein DNU06_00845 [Putridiphycobacter roseus]|uniref:DUF1684 domain-containing protein n=1 Tax=Putridiphycobacter roseus TaxID=2219161 RepID=A0A2W1N2P6_9FLAO|nr:DUF1684 domain-containing protein [Putridiphycobacter roseus]PZE18959.1 hypothetical protein DNU06_00845 [Putridiphycobacter roseus]
MKTLLFLISLLFFVIQGKDEKVKSITEIRDFQKELNVQYKDSVASPLLEKDRLKFKKHQFFKIDLDYRIMAKLELTPLSDTFGMKTSTARLPLYRKYGIAKFEVEEQVFELSIFQNIKYSQIAEYKNGLFLLFNDDTNGKSTYNGGRYIDLEIPKADSILIDFNQSYNPYCHYNDRYSCPIPPSENYLKTEIKAGIKKYKHAKKH